MEELLADKRQSDILLEKVIQITEDNLKAQGLYLIELNQIKNKFDMNDRDHIEVKEQLAHVTTNTFDILNKMNKSSNEEILTMLGKTEEFKNDFKHKFESAEENIKSIKSTVNNCSTELSLIKDNTIKTKDSFLLIQKLLAGILILATGIQIVSVLWKTVQDKTMKDKIEFIIKEELRSNKNKKVK